VKAAEAKGEMPEQKAKARGKFKSFGEMLCAVHDATFNQRRDPRLKTWRDSAEPDGGPFTMKDGWVESERKDLVERIGASGGFLVFPEHLTELFQLSPLAMYVRQRATVIPMSARVIQIPVLDQTGTDTSSHYYGGVIPNWTEEASVKTETEPEFRQMQLVAHKLVVYTEASDELLADSAVSLEALLRTLYASAIRNEEEFTFIQGTGAGQPLGVANVGCVNPLGPTIAVPRVAAGLIGLADIFNMVSQFQGTNPIWLAHQSALPQILQLNGPAGNPQYVWIGNGRDQYPTTLMGYPIYFIENCPTLGDQGDIILADWSKYLIGDRQAVTIDSSKHYRFRYDLTAWRAVHRVDGRPWLSAPLTYRDGTTQVSPFVILDDAVAT
jgi:HK97 family phage major capsid protein